MVNSTATVAELAGYLSNVSGDMTSVAVRIDLLTVIAMFLRNLLILLVFAKECGANSSGTADCDDSCLCHISVAATETTAP